jgi:hypothetical protein
MRRLFATGAVAIALALSACGGGDDEETSTSPAPAVDAPSDGTAPPGGLDALPPGFAECMAEQGYEIESSADIHSAPPEALQQCFGH